MKKILVIGSSGGIGNEVAKMLSKQKIRVFGTYFQHPENLENLRSYSTFTALYLDIRKTQTIEKLKDQISSELFAIVNCSGIVDFEGDNIKNNINTWQDTIATNLSGNYYIAEIFKETIEENGRFIMISSTDALFGGAVTAAYAASKAGVNSLTKSLALSYQDKKIRVNSISPGWVETSMAKIDDGDFLKKAAKINPLKSNAQPKDIANIIAFLLSDESAYINGQNIIADGGYTNQDPTLLIEEKTVSN